MGFLLMISIFILTILSSPFVLTLPFASHELEPPVSTRQVESGAACSAASGELVSENPCRPWCMCKDGVVVCAEIYCGSDMDVPESCGKIKVNGRCCPTFVCIHNNGSASMHYPLPLTLVPPSMYEDRSDSTEPTKAKRNLLQEHRRQKFL